MRAALACCGLDLTVEVQPSAEEGILLYEYLWPRSSLKDSLSRAGITRRTAHQQLQTADRARVQCSPRSHALLAGGMASVSNAPTWHICFGVGWSAFRPMCFQGGKVDLWRLRFAHGRVQSGSLGSFARRKMISGIGQSFGNAWASEDGSC